MKKPFYKRWWFIAIIVVVIIGAIGSGGDDETDGAKEAGKEKEVKEEEEVKEEIDLEVTGDMNVEFKEDKAIVTITTNAIDGSIFEVAIMDADINTVSDFITIKEGKGTGEIDVNKDWGTGYLGATAMLRFNLDEHPQPDNVKEVYGEHGENIKGDLAEENNLNGYNVNLKSISVPYPDKKTAEAKQDKEFSKIIDELIETSGGVIVDIKPRFDKDDWSIVAVIVSDVWYNSQEHEKERFAEQVGGTVSTLVANSGKVKEGESVMVYLLDTYNKELAKPKISGGYKIKK